MTDKFYVYRPLLELVGFTEGTAPPKGRGYNETLGYGAYTGGAVDLISMTLTQIDALQTKMLRHPKNKLNSSAVGMYQVIRTTLRRLRKDMPEKFPGDRLFDAECQDEIACYLFGIRGVDKYLAGRLKENSVIDNLAKEWASFPTTNDVGYYEGQRTPIKSKRVREALKLVKHRHLEGQPETDVIEKEVVPEKVEKEVRQKTNWLTSVFGASGIFAGFGSWLSGMEAQKLLLVAGITVAVVVVVLLFGEWMVRRVRSIRKAVADV